MTSAYKFINSFSCEMFRTKTCFEKAAKGNIIHELLTGAFDLLKRVQKFTKQAKNVSERARITSSVGK